MRQNIVHIGALYNTDASGTSDGVHIGIAAVEVLVRSDDLLGSCLGVQSLELSGVHIDELLIKLSIGALHNILGKIGCNARRVAAPESLAVVSADIYKTSGNSRTIDLAFIVLYIPALAGLGLSAFSEPCKLVLVELVPCNLIDVPCLLTFYSDIVLPGGCDLAGLSQLIKKSGKVLGEFDRDGIEVSLGAAVTLQQGTYESPSCFSGRIEDPFRNELFLAAPELFQIIIELFSLYSDIF